MLIVSIDFPALGIGWLRHMYPRKNGKTYFIFEAPDGTRFKSLKMAEASLRRILCTDSSIGIGTRCTACFHFEQPNNEILLCDGVMRPFCPKCSDLDRKCTQTGQGLKSPYMAFADSLPLGASYALCSESSDSAAYFHAAAFSSSTSSPSPAWSPSSSSSSSSSSTTVVSPTACPIATATADPNANQISRRAAGLERAKRECEAEAAALARRIELRPRSWLHEWEPEPAAQPPPSAPRCLRQTRASASEVWRSCKTWFRPDKANCQGAAPVGLEQHMLQCDDDCSGASWPSSGSCHHQPRGDFWATPTESEGATRKCSYYLGDEVGPSEFAGEPDLQSVQTTKNCCTEPAVSAKDEALLAAEPLGIDSVDRTCLPPAWPPQSILIRPLMSTRAIALPAGMADEAEELELEVEVEVEEELGTWPQHTVRLS